VTDQFTRVLISAYVYLFFVKKPCTYIFNHCMSKLFERKVTVNMYFDSIWCYKMLYGIAWANSDELNQLHVKVNVKVSVYI